MLPSRPSGIYLAGEDHKIWRDLSDRPFHRVAESYRRQVTRRGAPLGIGTAPGNRFPSRGYCGGYLPSTRWEKLLR